MLNRKNSLVVGSILVLVLGFMPGAFGKQPPPEKKVTPTQKTTIIASCGKTGGHTRVGCITPVIVAEREGIPGRRVGGGTRIKPLLTASVEKIKNACDVCKECICGIRS